jgi:hypothetical protein
MDSLCEDILTYIQNESDVAMILAFILRDIFMNELIVISYTGKWMQYNIYNKQWYPFDENLLWDKIDTITLFLKTTFMDYIFQKKLSKPSVVEKRIVNNMVDIVDRYAHEYLQKEEFLYQCREYFTIPS